MATLITGAGLIGSHVARILVERGDGHFEDLLCTVKPFRGGSRLTLTSVSAQQEGDALTQIGRHLSDEIQLIKTLFEE